MSGKIEKFMLENVSARTMIGVARFMIKLARPFIVTENDVLKALHVPLKRDSGSVTFYDSAPPPEVKDGEELPVPPRDLRWGDPDETSSFDMGRAAELKKLDPDAAWLAVGKATADAFNGVLEKHGESVATIGNVLDWGCSSARVLRHYREHTDKAQFWGADVGAPYIRWAQEHLSPPFRFVTTTGFPHLPFEDNSFGFVYAVSVMTHLEHLRDAWLAEIRRILRPGGFALFTIMDEHTVEAYRDHGLPPWLPSSLPLDEILKHDETIIRGHDWSLTFTFFRSEHIRRSWGRLFEVVDVCPYLEHNQTGILLRKPLGRA